MPSSRCLLDWALSAFFLAFLSIPLNLAIVNEQIVNWFISIILPNYFISEKEVLCHSRWLVITSKHYDILWKVDLETIKESYDFDWIIPCVSIVLKEKHIKTWQISAVNHFLKHMYHILKLTVYISYYDHWLFYSNHVGFVIYLYRFFAQILILDSH